MIAGMMSAVIQGAPMVTSDTDIWIDLPARQYMRLSNLCLKLGATMRANTVFVFPDDTMINFIYAATGLRSFASENRAARRVRWLGLREVPVLPLERTCKSRRVIRRPKDLVHMQVLKQLMGNEMATAKRRPRKRTQLKSRKTQS